MDRNEFRSVAGLLLYGDSGSVDHIAHELVARNDRRMWGMLVETIHSDEELPVRVRCLEVLARSASLGGDPTAIEVLTALGDGDPVHDEPVMPDAAGPPGGFSVDLAESGGSDHG